MRDKKTEPKTNIIIYSKRGKYARIFCKGIAELKAWGKETEQKKILHRGSESISV